MLPGLVSLLVWDLDGLIQVEGVRRFLQQRGVHTVAIFVASVIAGEGYARSSRSLPGRVAAFVASVIAGMV